ncbi:MAG: hypothetical protein KME53_14600, partial [Candidatus Thiodiazotropha sp. (ex Clathrolucina costata)]|nr:hypothetical protein [Candidatus Thiodiazotropha taylori]
GLARPSTPLLRKSPLKRHRRCHICRLVEHCPTKAGSEQKALSKGKFQDYRHSGAGRNPGTPSPSSILDPACAGMTVVLG